MCYKLLVALLLALVFLQYVYTSLGGTGYLYSQGSAPLGNLGSVMGNSTSTTNSVKHAPLFPPVTSIDSLAGNSDYRKDVKNLTAWIFSQITPVNSAQPIELCPLVPPNLVGVLGAFKDGGSLSDVESRIGDTLLPGGQWRPSGCKARDKVAIIVPYRDRVEQLSVFLANMHPYLQRQLIDYGIFIIEQAGIGDFNRAMLLNVGFVEALGLREFDCFIFHDVDLLPEDDRNLYTCPDQPRHMSVAVDVFNYRLPYSDIFGGVSAMTKEQFEKVNGFSNMFWGWGGEDDDMATRIKVAGYHITRYPVSIARYTMLPHTKQKANPKRFENLYNGKKRIKIDGLNSLQYRRVEMRLSKLFTWVLVELAKTN
ncbi:beta-1,4-N-acetylgalactosaminyltransferase bre-4-like [Cimex lectularius]|uniref:Beta-1,4-N-acetylgalactosaminyltransferase n=1 Tax=Cimex lectularius TaxID=79782 RepID=A0A8I6SUC8_CIMLE|nr:beta-1,4-N-acetylgalactosaminyltransferase bre-4-like [Cimex lectularius]XP_024086261.1 beta-1,4-N-acetylgalactosaminyltransferase bre-4-like [Cimex lectularius]XP_024086262.1 beta-1,4-N-acetylgalactosaminyltransferase bre-4-like [Cimex lectularius]